MNKFDHLIINGRPACGKSEFIDFMKGVSYDERIRRFHIGEIEEIDDYPWIHEKFLEDDIWEKCGHQRKYSIPDTHGTYLTSDITLYDFMIGKLNSEIKKRYMSKLAFYEKGTLFIEFARGMDDAYRRAYNLFDRELLGRSAILNVFVTLEESIRRNDARYKEGQQDSILFHKVPDGVISGYYKENDWLSLTKNQESGHIDIKGLKVPFVTMNNMPHLPAGAEIALRYERALSELWKLKIS